MHHTITTSLTLAALFAGLVSGTTAAEGAKPIVAESELAAGPFQATDASLQQYRYPTWFRDAKFGIWAHWGPQAVPRHGDWYARRMYEEKDADYKDHLAKYGPPSKTGYKDIIPLWKAEKWDPAALMALYKKAGAKYFVSMGSHHDNFFLWASKIHRWNAAQMGPMKDVVGIWQQAAQKEGLRFGVSEHLAASYTWFQASHGADGSGPLMGVAYDGADPQYADLYHTKAAPGDHGWLTDNTAWHREWFDDVKELIDTYHPDLLYSDSALPFGDVGRSMLAHYYNQDQARHGGTVEAVYNCKEPSAGKWVQDLERGVMDRVEPLPWQTDTSIGDWFYSTGQQYKSADTIIKTLADIVAKNGNLLINIVQTPEGDLEPDMLATLADISAWTALNGEAIYATRPWTIFGERPPGAVEVKGGKFNEDKMQYSAQDIRFTIKDGVIYALLMGWPGDGGQVTIASLATGKGPAQLGEVRMLGSEGVLTAARTDAGLVITVPAKAPCAHVFVLKIACREIVRGQ
ncbi:MAG: alpha-L-fucosidase [Planctomycetes bacterium]|nr:alpha-L-fucosidase [Planctomycetota bacterium]